MKTLSNYTKVLLGYDGKEPIYLTPPSWDCGWYWGFGYLGNKNCHYHINELMKDINLYDGLKNHFGKTFLIRESNIWEFAELFNSFYKLQSVAELYKTGCSGLTTNPAKESIKNTDEAERINSIVLPQIFEEIYKIIDLNSNNKKTFSKLVSLNLEGNTEKVIQYMLDNSIKTYDLKSIEGLTKDDVSIIHRYYWEQYHANK
jgi:hypothetical protein